MKPAPACQKSTRYFQGENEGGEAGVARAQGLAARPETCAKSAIRQQPRRLQCAEQSRLPRLRSCQVTLRPRLHRCPARRGLLLLLLLRALSHLLSALEDTDVGGFVVAHCWVWAVGYV